MIEKFDHSKAILESDIIDKVEEMIDYLFSEKKEEVKFLKLEEARNYSLYDEKNPRLLKVNAVDIKINLYEQAIEEIENTRAIQYRNLAYQKEEEIHELKRLLLNKTSEFEIEKMKVKLLNEKLKKEIVKTI